MKKILLLSILMAASNALADIPMPRPQPDDGTSQEIAEEEIEGPAALALYESLNLKETTTAALRTSLTTAKVLRAKNALNQVICEKTVSRLRPAPSANCVTHTSKDGKKLPPVRLAVRMG